jgi:collagenase-like PrtC family protease
LINRLNALKQIGIDTIRIDSFLHDEAWVNDTVKYYLLALKSKSNDNKQAITNFKKYDKLISEGFYEINRENLIYLKSLEQNNE